MSFHLSPPKNAPLALATILMALSLVAGCGGERPLPEPMDITATTDEDVALMGDLSAIRMGVPAEFELVTPPTTGRLELSADGRYTFTPAADQSGTETFEYRLVRGAKFTESATVTITIEAVNDAPMAVPDTLTLGEDESTTIDALANDSDIDLMGGELVVASVDGASTVGSVRLQADGQIGYSAAGAFDSLAEGETATDTFSYVVSDGDDTSVATVTVTITGTNDLPMLGDDSVTTDEDTPLTIDFLANDTDAEGDELTVHYMGDPSAGAITFDAEGRVVFDPRGAFDALAPGDSSVVTWTYRLREEGEVLDEVATISVTVTGVNDAPVFATPTRVDGCLSGARFAAATPTVTDPEGDTITFSLFEDCGFLTASATNGSMSGVCVSMPNGCTVELIASDGVDASTGAIVLQSNSNRYVAESTRGRGDGSAWPHAMSSVVDALTQATSAGGEVWIERGEYVATTADAPFLNVAGDVAIRGGFDGELDADLRAFDARATVLSGDINGDGRASAGDARIIVDVTSGTVTLDTLTVRHAYNVTTTGAGIRCGVSVSGMTLTRVISEENEATGPLPAGGAGFHGLCPSTQREVRYQRNHGTWGGGVILMRGAHVMENVEILDSSMELTSQDGATLLIWTPATLVGRDVLIDQPATGYGVGVSGTTATLSHATLVGRSGLVVRASGGSLALLNSVSDNGVNATLTDSCITTGGFSNSLRLTQRAASGEVFLRTDASECIDGGDATRADAVYAALGESWDDQTTLLSGVVEVAGSAPDTGVHWETERTVIRSFTQNNFQLAWDVRGFEGCELSNDANDQTFAISSAAGTYNGYVSQVPVGARIFLTCVDSIGPWSARADLTRQ